MKTVNYSWERNTTFDTFKLNTWKEDDKKLLNPIIAQDKNELQFMVRKKISLQ